MNSIFSDLTKLSADAFLQKCAGLSDPDTLGFDSRSLVQEAICRRKPELVQPLLRLGVSPHIHDQQGDTALHYAVTFGFVEAVMELLAAGASPNEVNKHGNTPLWTALHGEKSGPYPILELLLKAGADPEIVNRHGKSPRSLAQSADRSQALVLFDSYAPKST